MGLIALRHLPNAKEPAWGFPGSQEMLSQQQLLLITSNITSQRDLPGWALPLLAPAWGSTGSCCHQQLVTFLTEPLRFVSARPRPDPRVCKSTDMSCSPPPCQPPAEA